MRAHPWTLLVLVAALAGFLFAAFSTYDFVAHLDRQVHGLHCSFLPGVGSTDVTGTSGCAVTLMSPYSSVMRESIWGGIPISLPAMSVFAFLAFWALYLIVRRRQMDRNATLFLLAATGVPVLASLVMGYLSFATLGAACKLCIGIYVASAGVFVGALGLWLRARKGAAPPAPRRRGPDDWEGAAATVPAAASDTQMDPENRLGIPVLVGAFALGCAFVFVPVAAYAMSAPDYSRYIGSCGTLEQPEDEGNILLPIGPQGTGVPVVEVLDPLCPACRGFENRFAALAASERTTRQLLLFPLDDECNWMVSDAIHPGACAVSEAMLCAGDGAEEVLEWAFTEQESILAAAKADPDAAERMARQRFPALSDCIGSPAARARLNLALRWAVDNQLPVLTPQVYVGGTRVCDADTDLGMDFVLSRLIERTPPAPAPPAFDPPSPGDPAAATGPRRVAAPAPPASPTDGDRGAAEEDAEEGAAEDTAGDDTAADEPAEAEADPADADDTTAEEGAAEREPPAEEGMVAGEIVAAEEAAGEGAPREPAPEAPASEETTEAP